MRESDSRSSRSGIEQQKQTARLLPKSIDRTGGISSKRHSDIALKFNAQKMDGSRNTSKSLKAKGANKMNQTANYSGGEKWNKFKKKKKSVVEDQEKLLCIEMTGTNSISLSF